jgi:hypothetical protein
MDFIQTLASKLDLDPNQAQGVAGAVLTQVRGALDDDTDGDDATAAFDSAVPELGGWKAAAGKLMGGGDDEPDEGGLGGLLGGLTSGGGGGLLGAVAGAVGGADARNTVALVGLMSKLGLGADKAAMVAPIAYSFLKDRLDGNVLELALKAAPFLVGGGDDDDTPDEADDDGLDLGDALGALGSFLK